MKVEAWKISRTHDANCLQERAIVEYLHMFAAKFLNVRTQTFVI